MKRVLVVDDHVGVRRLVHAALNREAGVDEAADWPAALGLLQAGEYGAVLLDLGLPGAPAPGEMLAAVRARHPGAKIIIITGRDSAGKGLPEGVVLLPKPFDIADLRRLVRAALDLGTAGA